MTLSCGYAPQWLVLGAVLLATATVCCSGASEPPAGSAWDSRLQQPVSIAASYDPLLQTLAELQRQTAVQLTCEPSVASRRVVVFAKERSLAELMRNIARLVPTPPGAALWERTARGGVYTYRLTENLVSRNARAGLQEKRYRQMKARFQESVAISRLSAGELTALRATRPRLIANMPRKLLGIVNSLPADQLERVFQGQALDLPFGALDSGQQGTITGMIQGVQFVSGGEIVFNGSTDYPQCRLAVSPSGNPDRPGIRAMIWMAPGHGLGCPNLMDPPLPAESEQPDWLRAHLADEERQRRQARRQPPPGDALFRQTVTIKRFIVTPKGEPGEGKVRACFAADALREIATQCGIPIVADYDPGFDNYYRREGLRTLRADLPRVPVWTALNTICETWDLSWEARAGWVLVRSPRAVWSTLGELDMSPPWAASKHAGGPEDG